LYSIFSENPDLLVSYAECLLYTYVATSLIFKVSVSAEVAGFAVSDKNIIDGECLSVVGYFE